MCDKFNSNFREISSLGSGAFSTVFEAKNFKDDKSYAIKKIPITSEEKDKAMKEIEIIRSLNCEFVVSYIYSWIEDNYYIGSFDVSNSQNISFGNLLYSPYKPLLLHIQMELCSLTLHEFIKQMNKTKLDSVTIEEYTIICDVFKQLLECVQYLHERKPPIIHRDLKPENIMLITNENRYKVKVTDFGLSTYHNFVDQSHTKYVGTKGYRAPEVDTKRYDTKADIWSLGKIMEILFQFDINSDSNENDLEIQSKYENAKQICFQCVSYIPKQRPDCQQLISSIHSWSYNTNDSNSISLNENRKIIHTLYSIFTQKWQKFDICDEKMMNKCKIISIIQEIEEKAIFISKDGGVYAIRISDHIDSTIQEPKIITELLNKEFQSIVCGYYHVLCLTKEMRVYSFGENSNGQLGNGTYISHNKPSIINELNKKRIIDIKCGAYHSLALSEYGSVLVWGSGMFGQIGNEENYRVNIPKEVIALKDEKIISISCGYQHCIALSESGSLYGWGDDEYKPIKIDFEDKISVIKISCGRSHTLILTSDDEIYSFGDNTFGQLGIGKEIYENKPIKIQTTIKFVDIYTTFYHNLSIGLSHNEVYYVWGECNDQTITSPKQTNFNSFYETFIYYSLNYKVFQTITTDQFSKSSSFINKINEWNIFKNINHQFMSNIYSLSIVRTVESKAILVTNDDMVYTFRLNDSIDYSSEKPIIVTELSNKRIKSIICGYNHVLCLTENNEVYSFGDNNCGELGNGSQINNYKPTIITELSNKQIIEIGCGAYHCLALSNAGNLFVWGYGAYGQTGIGDKYFQLTPIKIQSFNSKEIISISCGAHHCLALASNGELYGWGDNRFGQLGIGNNINQNKPILIENRNEIAINKISCGLWHSLLLTSDYNIYSFGINDCGQLGIGNNEDQNRMSKIDKTLKFVDISCHWNANISAGLSQTGDYYVWGECGDHVITTPTITDFTSFNELFTKYAQNFLAKHLLNIKT